MMTILSTKRSVFTFLIFKGIRKEILETASIRISPLCICNLDKTSVSTLVSRLIQSASSYDLLHKPLHQAPSWLYSSSGRHLTQGRAYKSGFQRQNHPPSIITVFTATPCAFSDRTLLAIGALLPPSPEAAVAAKANISNLGSSDTLITPRKNPFFLDLVRYAGNFWQTGTPLLEFIHVYGPFDEIVVLHSLRRSIGFFTRRNTDCCLFRAETVRFDAGYMQGGGEWDRGLKSSNVADDSISVFCKCRRSYSGCGRGC